MHARWVPLAALVTFPWIAGGCNTTSEGSRAVSVHGSSTAYPLSEAASEEFQRQNPSTRVTVGFAGTGAGFQKFCAGEVDATGASRPIGSAEVELCRKGGVEFVELPTAYDGLAVVAHPTNTWADAITVDELRRMWEPAAQGKVLHWSEVRPGWPDRELHLFGAGVDSGTYDYFTAAIVGEEHSSRLDYNASEDDNTLVEGVARSEWALGFFGYAYYQKNRDRLKLVAIDDGKADNGDGPIVPSPESVTNGTYQPLSRPIFLYVSAKALVRTEVAEFAAFYVRNAAHLSSEVGYIPLPPRAYELALHRLQRRAIGSIFKGAGSQVGIRIDQLLELAQQKE